MRSIKTAILAATIGAGLAGLSSPAEAQYYPQGYGYTQGHPPRGYYQQPTYIPPKILRKQKQLEQRVIQKYGYQQPAPYGYAYQQPPQQYYYQQQPRYYQQPRYRQSWDWD